MNNFFKDKFSDQEILLLNACFVFGGLVIYILFLLFFTFYQQLSTNLHTNSLLQFLTNIFFHKDHISYLSVILIVFMGCFFAHMFWLVINKFNSIKKIIYTINLSICTLVNNMTRILSNYAQAKNIKTSKLLGRAYLLVFVTACVVAAFTNCLEIKETNFLMLIVMPLTTASLIYGIGYTLSNYTQYLDSIFPQNITDTKKLSIELLKFLGITIGGMLLMLTPLFSKIILSF